MNGLAFMSRPEITYRRKKWMPCVTIKYLRPQMEVMSLQREYCEVGQVKKKKKVEKYNKATSA